MAEFDDLPEEIILKILTYLPQSQLHDSIAHVCRKLARISKDITLYHCLILDEELSWHVVRGILEEYFWFVQSLVINDRSDANRILEMVPTLENLRTLKVNSCSGCNFPYSHITAEVDADLISNIVEKNIRLTGLWITHSTIRPGEIKMCEGNFREIVLKNTYYQRSLEERGLLSLRNLQVIKLQNVVVNKSTLSKVILNNKNTLHTIKLDVWEPPLTGSNDRLIEAIGCCQNVRHLVIRNVSFHHISDEAIQRLMSLEHLQGIKFSNIENVIPKAFILIFGLHFKYLQKIYLNACDGINSTVIKTIATNCPHLLEFAINQPKATEENLVRSEDILYLTSKCKKLQLLDMCYTHSSIGQSIAHVVSDLPVLRRFKYCLNSRTDEDFLISIYNYLAMNLSSFNMSVHANIHRDKYIIGSRSKVF